MLKIYQQRESKQLPYTYFGSTGPYLGVELELDTIKQVNSDLLRQQIANILDCSETKDHYVLELDVTLKHGLEVIFHPHTLEELHQLLRGPFAAILTKLKQETALEEGSPYAGVHIHISRTFFGETIEIQNQNIAKLWYFMSRYPLELVRCVGQKRSLAAAKVYNYGMSKEAAITKVATEYTQHSSKNRFQAINVTTENTVEFRFFRATLDLTTLLFFIDFCYYFAARAITASWEECTSWDTFFQDVPENLSGKLKAARAQAFKIKTSR